MIFCFTIYIVIAIAKVDQVYKDPTFLNLDEVVEQTGFSRIQIVKLYALYKTLCKVTLTEQNENESEIVGVNFNNFQNGINELALENKELVKKIFQKADSSHTGYLNWDEFLESMRIIFTESLEIKIELFFDIIDR